MKNFKELIINAVARLFEYVGSKQLVMCCTGIMYETKIPEELKK